MDKINANLRTRGLPEVPQRKILVTGLGRGGTSSIASMLFHAGFNVSGESPPNRFFEDEGLRALLMASRLDELRDELVGRAAKYGSVAWKDPKLYSEGGLELLQRLPAEWLVIAVFRDPVAIALRRVASDQVDFSESIPRVLKFMRRLHNFVAAIEKHRQVIYVSYEKIVTEPVVSICGLFRQMGAELDEETATELWGQMRESQRRYLQGEPT